MKKSILALSMLALVFVSCKKDEDEQIAPTKDNLIGSYKISAVTATSGGTTVDMFNNPMVFAACTKDDIYKLKTDMTYDLQDAGTVCSPAGDDSGTWAISGTTLTIDSEVGTIKSWNGKTLVVEVNDTGTNAVWTSTYQRQ